MFLVKIIQRTLTAINASIMKEMGTQFKLTTKSEVPNPRMISRVVEMVSGLYGYDNVGSSQRNPRTTGVPRRNKYNTGSPTEKTDRLISVLLIYKIFQNYPYFYFFFLF